MNEFQVDSEHSSDSDENYAEKHLAKIQRHFVRKANKAKKEANGMKDKLKEEEKRVDEKTQTA